RRLLALAPVRHVLVTSATRRLARVRMESAGVDPRTLRDGRGVSASKPDPEGFLAAAAALGIPATPDNAPLRPGTGTAVQPGAQRASITLARPSLPAASA